MVKSKDIRNSWFFLNNFFYVGDKIFNVDHGNSVLSVPIIGQGFRLLETGLHKIGS